VGMWAGLTARNPNRAPGVTVVRVLVLPMVAMFLTMLFIQLFVLAQGPSYEPSWQFVMGLYFGLGLATDLFFGLRAWRNLHTRFRVVATQRFATQAGLWQRLFGSRPQSPRL